ncbi:MAG: transglutaminase family protein [SAR324 cluster bacterium]|nr:transglutaminase family protein [SAR324 cluster bacterium]
MPVYNITHKTHYRYEEPVSLCHNEIRMLSREFPHQRSLKTEVHITPQASIYSEREDFFGNRVAYFSVERPHALLEIVVNNIVETVSQPPVNFKDSPAWDDLCQWLETGGNAECFELREFCHPSPKVPLLPGMKDYALISFLPGRPVLEATMDLTSRIFKDFIFDPKATDVSTPLSKVWQQKRGVCQDFAHVGIACLRSLGLPARYVSGYLETLPPPGKPKLIGVDMSHAWFSVGVPQLAWFDFDPTNNQMPSSRHISIAWGRDYSDVTPLKGIIFGGGDKQELKVSVDVSRRPDRTIGRSA